jgi:glutamate-5-semialdehyde dehydrogenase
MTTELAEQIDTKSLMQELGTSARKASRELVQASTGSKNAALERVAELLVESTAELQAANSKDLEAGRLAGLSSAMLDRLELTHKRINGMSDGLRQVAQLPDPVGEMFEFNARPNGLKIGKMRVPIGVIGIIYESRPNVTADAAGLCLKSGNACILRGGKEAIHSNQMIAEIFRRGIKEAGLPEDAVQLIPTTDRAMVGEMVGLGGWVDCVVPRGGRSLIEAVMSAAHVPVIKHLDGICHVYIHDKADLAKAEAIAINSKTHRTGVCNSAETLLLDASLPQDFISGLIKKFLSLKVELRGCERTQAINSAVKAANDDDWGAEYLDMILAVKIVDDLDAAIAHINDYGSQHTDAIVSEDYSACMRFMQTVDSACVHINASTRFSDGGEYGLGCEIGISTDKLHARGPMGLKELTSVKWVALGDGQIRH